MEHQLRPPILAWLAAAESGITPLEESEHLNRIAGAYRTWLDIQAQILWRN
jgi:hypothetical protein